MSLIAHVEALCSPACAGRGAGSPEGARARAYIVSQLERAALRPAIEPVRGCGGANVIATVGEGPRTVLLAAHYDHLGGAYLGADDNAAAVAVLLEAAARPAPANGRVIFAFFDGEEPPHFLTPAMGSMAYVAAHRTDDLDLMIALDLVGHAVGPAGSPPGVAQTIFALGAEKSPGLGAIVDRGEPGLAVRRLGIDLVPPLSDYEAFRRERVPFLFLTCGRWRHYHTVDDRPEHLDYAKMAATQRLLERLVRDVLAGPPRSFDEGARDHAATIASLTDLCRAIADPRAAVAVSILDGLRRRLGPGGELAIGDWSTLVQLLGTLEQGLA